MKVKHIMLTPKCGGKAYTSQGRTSPLCISGSSHVQIPAYGIKKWFKGYEVTKITQYKTLVCVCVCV